jgi:hypothetical protein
MLLSARKFIQIFDFYIVIKFTEIIFIFFFSLHITNRNKVY